MSNQFRVDLNAGTRLGRTSPREDPESPFCIAVLGDFSGRGDQVAEQAPTGEFSHPVEVRRDNLDAVMSTLGVQCEMDFGDQVVRLKFSELDDFLPDRLYEACPLFSRFRQLRHQLHDPSTFDEAAREVRSWGLLTTNEVREAAPAPEKPAPARQPETRVEPIRMENLLDQAIARSERPQAESAATTDLPSEIDAIVRQAVAPYRIAKPPADRDDLVGCVDAMASHLMQRIMHDRRFQSIEAAWRGLDFLLRRSQYSPRIKVHVIDLGWAQLASDLGSVRHIEESATYKLVVDRSLGTPGALAWSLLIGNYTVDATSTSVLLAGCLAKIAADAKAPFLAAASPRLVGCESLATLGDRNDSAVGVAPDVAQTWHDVRLSAAASYMGLVVPRFLLRMPYGAESCPVDGFDFEEVPNQAEHEAFLWGNPAIVGACLLAKSFWEMGWEMVPDNQLEIENLPLFVYDQNGEECLLPCTEASLTERAIQRIVAAGLMPLFTIQGTGTARLARWQSISLQSPRLSGPWIR